MESSFWNKTKKDIGVKTFCFGEVMTLKDNSVFLEIEPVTNGLGHATYV